MIEKMRIAILGFGREGQSLLRYLRKNPTYRRAEIAVLDKNPETRVPAGIARRLGPGHLHGLSDYDIIFRSPGVPYTLPQLYRARCDGVNVTSATRLFFEELKKLVRRGSPQVIGITGTKGKGTTATLLAEILRRAGQRVILAGNIGRPMLDVLPQVKRADYVILELSSFQLQDLPVSPHIAVVLDVFPDHLDEHKTLREYYGSKANIGRFQKKDDTIFYFADNKFSKQVAQRSPARKIAVVPRRSGVKKNYDMAAAVAQALGVTSAVVRDTIQKFKGLEHRLEFVREVRGVRFINDSAATNPAAAAAAVQSFSEPSVLIAGGYDKGLNYKPLAEALKRSRTRLVVLFGANKKKIYREIRGEMRKEKREIKLAKDLKTAIVLAYKFARKLISHAPSPIPIVLSPGAASFDMFKNYGHRGKEFKRIVKAL